MPYTTIASATPISVSWANSNVRDQVVSQFASTAARDSAITSPVNGMVCVTNDTNSVWLYNSVGWTKIGGGSDTRTTLYYPRSFQRLNIAGSILSFGTPTFILNGVNIAAPKIGDYAIVTATVRVQNASALGQAVFTMVPYVGATGTADAQRLVSTVGLGAGDDEQVSGTWLYTFASTTSTTFAIIGETTTGAATAIAPDTWMTVQHFSLV